MFHGWYGYKINFMAIKFSPAIGMCGKKVNFKPWLCNKQLYSFF